jgi:hypothetical protein
VLAELDLEEASQVAQAAVVDADVALAVVVTIVAVAEEMVDVAAMVVVADTAVVAVADNVVKVAQEAVKDVQTTVIVGNFLKIYFIKNLLKTDDHLYDRHVFINTQNLW